MARIEVTASEDNAQSLIFDKMASCWLTKLELGLELVGVAMAR